MRIAKKAGLTAAALILLCGCSVYKEYQRPEGFRTDTLTVIGWEEFFPDTLLRNLIRTGLENNPELVSARQKVIAAQASAKASRLAYLPGLNLSPSGSLAHSDERYNGNAFSYSLPLTASWEIDIAGRTFNNRRIAETAAKQSEVYVRSVRTELVATIADLYYSLLKLDAQLEVSRTTAESWKENVRTMKAMKEAGMTNEASVAQTTANACSIEASLYDLEYQVSRTQNELCVLIGIEVQELKRGSLHDASLNEGIPQNVSLSSLGGRPDVQHAELELRKAFYNTALAHAQFYPSLTINGEFGWEKALTSPAGWLASAGAGLVQPLFSRGRLKANLTAAQAHQEEAAAAFRKTLLNAGAEVNDALHLIASTKSKTDVRARQIESLKSAENSTRQLMRHSESTYLEVLTAQQSLLSAQLLQISDRYDALEGSIALYKALGGGAD